MGAHATLYNQIIASVKSLAKASIAAVMLTALAATAVSVPAANAQQSDALYRGSNGIGIVTKVFDDSTSAAEVEESFRTAAEMGVEWTRIGAAWYHIENERGWYNWKFLDQTVAMAEKYGINVMMQVTTAPRWATGLNELSPAQQRSLGHYLDTYAPKPEYYDDYANFFAAVVERYAPRGIVDYEVWNEPGLVGFWKEGLNNRIASPESYTELLKKTYPKAHRAYSSVNVIAGGQVVLPTESDETQINAVDYLKRMYAAGAQGYFDSLGHHPYGIGATEWVYNGWAYIDNEPRTNNASPETLRSVMQANGDGHKEIWLTELGQDTKYGASDEKVQSERYQLYLDAWRKTPNTGPMIFYHLHDKKPYGRSRSNEDYFGVVRTDGTWKLAAQTIKNYTDSVDTGSARNRGALPAAPAPAPAAPPAELQSVPAPAAAAPAPAPAPVNQKPNSGNTGLRDATIAIGVLAPLGMALAYIFRDEVWTRMNGFIPRF